MPSQSDNHENENAFTVHITARLKQTAQMSQFTLAPASKAALKLRIALLAPSGAGKTFSALLLASGLAPWGKIAVIDTENGSANYYADLGPYQVIDLQPPYTPERYIAAIQSCESAGMEVIVLDSISHEWAGKGGILEAQGAMQGNSFTNWGKVTPRHDAFVDAMRTSKCHVIATIRTKQAHEQMEKNGRLVVEKVGLGPIQRDNIEFEFGLALTLDMKHNATTSKDRTRLFDGRPEFLISPDTGEELLAWANSADPEAIARAEQAELQEWQARVDAENAAQIKGLKAEVSRMMKDTTIIWPQKTKDDVTARWAAAIVNLPLIQALHADIAEQYTALNSPNQ